MNKHIYYSVFDVVNWLTNTKEVKQDTGWGRLTTTMRDLLVIAGYDLVSSPDDAGLEFYVGQPPFCLRPQMHPSVTLSMFETDRLPKIWVESFNRWDAIINPSKWGHDCFQQSGVNKPIYVVPLPINFDKFKYCEHNVDEWTFIAQAVQLLDRKCVNLVIEAFQSGKMPSDTKLIVKTTPARSGCEFDMWLDEQIHLIQVSLPFSEYYDLLVNSHVSVNPSSGEGFCYLGSESMAVGLCTMMTDYSAMCDLLANNCTIPLKNDVTQTDLFVSGGNDAKVDTDDLLAKMIWTYEHQDEALAIGKRSSEWIRNYCSQDKIVDKLDQIFAHLIATVPKSVHARKDTDPEDYWIHKESLRRELAWRDEQHSM